jgi:spoIIIJ-associated protein
VSHVSETTNTATETPFVTAVEDAAVDQSTGADSPIAGDGPALIGGEARSTSQLEEEGEIAADYIEELLDITDLDGDIEIDTRGGRAYVSVKSGEEASLRLLSRPDTVSALQELTRIAVQTKIGGFSRLILDVGGSREARVGELTVLVDKAIERIEAGSASAALPPMSSYERKLVHDVVSERGFSSASEGEGRDRHTVITTA